jgi:hypothetical protein
LSTACQSPTIKHRTHPLVGSTTGAGWCVHGEKCLAQPPHKNGGEKCAVVGLIPATGLIVAGLCPGSSFFHTMGCQWHETYDFTDAPPPGAKRWNGVVHYRKWPVRWFVDHIIPLHIMYVHSSASMTCMGKAVLSMMMPCAPLSPNIL